MMLSTAVGLHLSTARHKCYALFGVKPEICKTLSLHLLENEFTGHPHYLLWRLLFLKDYATGRVHCTIATTSANSFRKWSWIVVNKLSNLKIVRIVLSPLLEHFVAFFTNCANSLKYQTGCKRLLLWMPISQSTEHTVE